MTKQIQGKMSHDFAIKDKSRVLPKYLNRYQKISGVRQIHIRTGDALGYKKYEKNMTEIYLKR